MSSHSTAQPRLRIVGFALLLVGFLVGGLAPVAQAVDPVTNVTAPWISGGAKSGSTLTANKGTWNPASASLTVQWLANGTPVAGATGDTYTIPTNLFSGAAYSLRLTASSAGLTSATVTSLPTSAAAGELDSAAFENRLAPTVIGSPVTGGTLSASTGQWSSTPSAFAYQWAADGGDIAGAIGSTFVPTPAQLGKAIVVKVKATSGNATPTAASAPTAQVTSGPLTNTTLPTVSGTAKVGNVLTATPGTWSVSGATFAYQWFADASPVAGATAVSFTPTSAQVGKQLAVKVTATLTGYTSGVAQSVPNQAVAPGDAPVSSVAPSISGVLNVGKTLTANPGTWTPTPTSYAYQWKAAGTDIAGATAPTFTLTSAELGKVITVTVHAKKVGFQDGVATSPATTPVSTELITVTRGPKLGGKARVGQVLRAVPGTVTPSNVKVTYQWLRSGKVIPGATRSTHGLTTSDLGSRVSVRVTYSRSGSPSVIRTSPSTGKVTSTPQFTVLRAVERTSVNLEVDVKAPGVSAVSGLITVFENGKKLAGRALSGGRVFMILDGLTRGPHTLTIRLSGNGNVADGSTRTSIRIG